MRRIAAVLFLLCIAFALCVVVPIYLWLRGNVTQVTITNERTGEVRTLQYRYRWMARVRSWFVAFPNWELAKATRVSVRPVLSSELRAP